MRRPREILTDWIISVVTKPRRVYRRYGSNDVAKLKKHVRKCDVILVDGDQRVSQAIKTLTMSSWSHNCVYIGDELVRRNHPMRDEVERRFGKESRHLVIEALVSTGVVVSPLIKYLDFNLRICRAFGLRADDAQTVLDDLISQIGNRYDVKNFTDLMRYLLPFHWIPARFREDALHLGSGVATETICSSMTAAAFQKVGFPILADFRPEKPQTASERLKAALFGRRARRAYTGLFHSRHPTLIVPRDFDLSPYFEIVKFNAIADGSLDYRKIRWARMNVFPEAKGRPRR